MVTDSHDKTAREIVAINAPMLSPGTFSDLVAAVAAAIRSATAQAEAERDEAWRIADLRLEDTARCAELAVRLAFTRMNLGESRTAFAEAVELLREHNTMLGMSLETIIEDRPSIMSRTSAFLAEHGGSHAPRDR